MRAVVVVLLAGLLAGCGGGGSDASTCAEYAADVRELIAETSTAADVQDFLDDTEELVVDLLLASRGDEAAGTPCAEAVLEASFVVADRSFAEEVSP